MSSNAAIIVAAGSSLRFGEDKLMALVQERPLISYSLQTFAAIPFIEEMVLVVAPGCEASFHKLLQEMNIAGLKKINIVPGGKNRHESVQQGLRALSSNIEWVAIHDGARPLISRMMIENCFQKALEHGAAALAAPVTETLHRADEKNLAGATVDRTHLWSMQIASLISKLLIQTISTWLTAIFQPLASHDRILHQHRNRHRSDAAWDRRDRGAAISDGFEVNIPNKPITCCRGSVRNTIDADINNDGSFADML